MLREPIQFKAARAIVLACFSTAFIFLLIGNVSRFQDSPRLQQITTEYDYNQTLPDFFIEPPNNRTLLSTAECAIQQQASLAGQHTGFHMKQELAGKDRRSRHDTWMLYQYKQTLPSSLKVDEVVAAYQRDHAAAPLSDPERAINWLTYWMSHKTDNMTSAWEVDESWERWSEYQITMQGSGITNSDSGTIVCRMDRLNAISVANSTVLTPTIGARSNISMVATVGMWLDTSRIFANYMAKTFPVFRAQHAMFRLTLEKHCEFRGFCMAGYCTQNPTCHKQYKVSTMSNVLVTDSSTLPDEFQNSTIPVQQFAYFSISLEEQGSTFEITVVTFKSSYGLLEVLASLFSAISILLLLYKKLMGDFRLNPLGWVQRKLLRSRTTAFIERVLGDKDDADEWLEHVLFSLYLNGNGLEGDETVGFKDDVKRVIHRLKSRHSSRKQDNLV